MTCCLQKRNWIQCMLCLYRFFVVPLAFVCTCQFVSACHALDLNTKSAHQNMSAESVPLQKAEITESQKTEKPAWHGTVKDGDPLDSATDIYSESLSKPAGISEYQGLVFCIVEIPMIEGEDDDFVYEMDGMLQEKEMLQKHYRLPSGFQLQRRVLENRIDDDYDYFRYATVYRMKDIQALQQLGSIDLLEK